MRAFHFSSLKNAEKWKKEKWGQSKIFSDVICHIKDGARKVLL
jgi:hypothetical protein